MSDINENYDDFAFDYNDEDAAKADSAADRLTDSGRYIGAFKCVSPFKSTKGSIGIQFDAELEDGGLTNFGLFVKDKDGKQIFGMQNYLAIRLILGCKGTAKPIKGKVRKYENGAWSDADGPVYHDMMNKKIGLVLQKELYTKSNGKDGVRFNLVTVFDAKTNKTAKEIINGDSSAKRLDKILKTLTDKDTRTAKHYLDEDSAFDDGGNYGGL